MIFFYENPIYLNFIYNEAQKFLKEKLDLQFNDKKKCINLISKGFDFVGYVIKPDRVYLRRKTQNKAFYKAKNWNNIPDKFSKSQLVHLRNVTNSYLGLARKTNNYNFRKKLCKNIAGSIFISSAKDYKKIVLNC